MFCPSCGKQSAPNANFCSACGTAALPLPAPERAARIVRPRQPRMIAGVCSGFAIHFGWDISLVRIILCVFTILTSGLGLICYLAAWLILPDAQYALPAQVRYQSVYPYPPHGEPTSVQPGQGSQA